MCSFDHLDRLDVGQSSIRENNMLMRAFDGSKNVAVGKVDLLLEIRPCHVKVPFIVVDIPATFTMLLGCPLIHTVGAIRSSLL